MQLRVNKTGAIALAIALCVSPLGAMGNAAFSQTLRTDGISSLNQIVQAKNEAANDALLEGAENQRELVEEQERVRQAQEARTRLRQPPSQTTAPLPPCPGCILTGPMASVGNDDKD